VHVARPKENNTLLVLLLLDIRRFKEIQRYYGHPWAIIVECRSPVLASVPPFLSSLMARLAATNCCSLFLSPTPSALGLTIQQLREADRQP